MLYTNGVLPCWTVAASITDFSVHVLHLKYYVKYTFRHPQIINHFCFRVPWLFAINALVYLATNSRIREAYRTFMKDMWKKIFNQTKQTPDHNRTDTSAFWIGLRNRNVNIERK